MSEFNKQSYIERGKRIDSQVNEFLAEKAEKAAADREADIKRHRETLMEGASHGIAETVHKNKIRERNLVESLTYLEKTSKAALTEMVSVLVEKSLLLDEYTYSRLNPGYKDQIRETVSGLLEGVDSFDITDERVAFLIETISKQIPSPTLTENGVPTSIPLDYAVSLTEARTKATMEGDGGEDVNAVIDDLSGNVKKRVAKIVDKDKKALQKAEAEYADAVGEDPNAAPETDMPPEDAEDPNAMPPEGTEDPNATAPEGEMPPEGVEDPNAMPPEGEMPPMDGNPKKQIQMLPDGTMNINVFESFVREMPPCGILEVLAINEAMDMVNEGKEYNSDLAIANAITYITVLETLDTTGILPVTDQDYQKIIAAAKGISTDDAKKFAPQVKVPQIKVGVVASPVVPEADETFTSLSQTLVDYVNGKKDKKEEPKKDEKKTITESELIDILESCGYALSVDDFEECYKAQGYRKIGPDKYVK